MRLSLVLAGASLVFGQTQVDLRSQSRNIDFSGATAAKPVPVGTVLPATCSAGAMFFKSDAVPGANLFGCVATNTWALLRGGTSDFSDLESASVSDVYSLSGGQVRFAVNGLPVVIKVGPSAIQRIAGSDTGSFWIYIDYNAGSPILRCAAGAGLNISNYQVTGDFADDTCITGSGFPARSIPVAMVDVSLGLIQTPADFRSIFSQDPVVAGTGLTLTGNVLSVSGASASGGLERVAFSSLPTCTLAQLNTGFLISDGVGLVAQCDGTSLAYFYQGQKVSLPGSSGAFTQVNATGGNSLSDDRGGLYVRGGTSSGNSLMLGLKPLSGGTDVRAAVVLGLGGGDGNACGLVLTDGTSGSSKATLFGGRTASNASTMGVLNYATATTTPTVALTRAVMPGNVLWLRVVIASGNHQFYTSSDGGNNWEQVGTQSAYETATQYGVGCDAGGSGTSAGMTLVSLSVQ